LFLSHALLTKAAFADKAAELVAACLPNIVAGVKQLQRYSKVLMLLSFTPAATLA
jgi:hypothetical protein